jgi:hypothetical protein
MFMELAQKALMLQSPIKMVHAASPQLSKLSTPQIIDTGSSFFQNSPELRKEAHLFLNDWEKVQDLEAPDKKTGLPGKSRQVASVQAQSKPKIPSTPSKVASSPLKTPLLKGRVNSIRKPLATKKQPELEKNASKEKLSSQDLVSNFLHMVGYERKRFTVEISRELMRALIVVSLENLMQNPDFQSFIITD